MGRDLINLLHYFIKSMVAATNHIFHLLGYFEELGLKVVDVILEILTDHLLGDEFITDLSKTRL